MSNHHFHKIYQADLILKTKDVVLNLEESHTQFLKVTETFIYFATFSSILEI